MNKEEVSLPDIITMTDGNLLRDTHAEMKEKKKEKKLSSQKLLTYVNVNDGQHRGLGLCNPNR